MRVLAGATTALRRIVDLGLVLLILVVLLAIILGKGAPLAGRQSIVIGGGSMEPAIGLGSAIIIRPVAASDLGVGDVVSMQVGPEHTTYTHRIVAVFDRADGRWIRTQGDANAAPDPTLVPAGAVIGRVELVIPYAGYLLALLSLPMGVMFVLGLAATLLAIAWLLESLELEPRPARRTAGSAARDAAFAILPDPAPTAAPGIPTGPLAAAAPDWLQGEPIAARPSAPLQGDAGDGPDLGSGRRRSGVRSAPAASPSAMAYARPTVREQLARSRELRDRRARWLIGRERGRPLLD